MVATENTHPSVPNGYPISEQFREPENRFVLLAPRGKNPIETAWVSTANYAWDNPQLIAHIASGGNYGVMMGMGGLIVVDSDDISVAFTVEERLPQTFKTITGSGGTHSYYHVRGTLPRSSELSYKGEHVGDLLSIGRQAVGPGSIHPCGGVYSVRDDSPIAEITAEELGEALLEFLPLPEDAEKTVAKEKTLAHKNGWKNIDEVLIADVIDITGLRRQGRRLQGPHPVHGSTTGGNFVADEDKNIGYCFRHKRGGGAVYWLGVAEGNIECGAPSPRGKQFKAIVEAARRRGLLESEPKAKEADKEDDNVEPMPCTDLQDLVTAIERHGLGYLGRGAVAELALLLTTNLPLYLNGGSGEGKSYVAERLCDFVVSESVGFMSVAGLYQSGGLDGKTLLVTEWDTIVSGKSRDAGTEAILRATIGAPEGARRTSVMIGTKTGKPERIEIPVCRIIACSVKVTDDEQWRTRFHFFPIHYIREAFIQQCVGAPRLPEKELKRWKKTLALISGRPVTRDPALIEFIVGGWMPIPKDGRQTNLLWSLVEAHARLRASEVASMQDYRAVYDIVHDRWTRPPTETAASLWELLGEAGYEGVALADMMKTVSRSERTIKRYLKDWRNLGLVETTAPAGGRAARWVILSSASGMPGDPVLPPPPPVQSTILGPKEATSVSGDTTMAPTEESAGCLIAPVTPPLCPPNEPVLNGIQTGAEPMRKGGVTMTPPDTDTPSPVAPDGGTPSGLAEPTPGRLCLICGNTTTSKLVLEGLTCPYCGADWPDGGG